METKGIKEKAKDLIDLLPENSTWDDLMYEIYVRQAIESGLSDSEVGNVISLEEVRVQFGLKWWKYSGRKPLFSIYRLFTATYLKILPNMPRDLLIN